MFMFKLFVACGVIAVGALSVEAADMELQLVDKNCWIEIFEDDNYDANDPHVKIQGPKEVSTMKNLEGKDWANDIESVIVGSNASVHAYEDKDFKGTEITFAPGQRVPNLGKLDMANDIESMKISCGR
jgi:Beta/Gamma crystallin